MEWKFELSPEENFDCDFLMDLIDAFAVIAPEFAVEDVTLGEEIDAVCKEAMSHAGKG